MIYDYDIRKHIMKHIHYPGRKEEGMSEAGAKGI